jgi:Fe-S cluster assembly protein SufD
VSELEAARERWVALFAEREKSLARSDGPGLRRLRRECLARFSELGFPTTRQEEWRYTNVEPLARVPFRPGRPDPEGIHRSAVESLSFPVFACHLFVFVNGRFAPELSAPGALSGHLPVRTLQRLRTEDPAFLEANLGRCAAAKQHPFVALNGAFLDDGAVVRVPPGLRLAEPIHLVFLSSGDAEPSSSQPRVLVVAGRGSHATVVQDHVSLGLGTRFTNAVSEALVEEDASLSLVLLQREHEATFHVCGLHAVVERGARFSSHTLCLGGALVRNDLSVRLADEGAACRLDGLFVGTGRQLLDNHTEVDHPMPRCSSEELYKGILGGSARGVFRGRIIVRPGAVGTDARQQNPNVLLCDGAEIDSKPQLEIYADDVKCSHGSAIGRLDPDAMFYLRSRGLAEARARDLLIRGFATEILDRLPARALGDAVAELLVARLRSAGGAS